MSTSLSISLDAKSRATLARIHSAGPRVQSAIRGAVDRENQLTVGQIVQTKLSRRGSRTLGVITNRLRNSIHATSATITSDGAITSSIGSNVTYAGIHEFGFTGEIRVRSHSRRIAQIFGKKISPTEIFIREHTRQVSVPERAYIRTTIEERAENYRATIGAAIETTFKNT